MQWCSKLPKLDYAEVYHSTTVKLFGVVDVFNSLIWHTCYYSTGDFEIYCPESTNNVKLMKIGNWVKIPNDSNIAIVENIQTSYSAQDGRMLVVTGRMATSILDRRIIYKRYGTSYIVYPTIINGNVQDAINSLISDCFINPIDSQRKWSSLTNEIGSASSSVLIGDDGNPAERQFTYKGLHEYVEALLQEYKFGARMLITDHQLGYYKFFG